MNCMQYLGYCKNTRTVVFWWVISLSLVESEGKGLRDLTQQAIVNSEVHWYYDIVLPFVFTCLILVKYWSETICVYSRAEGGRRRGYMGHLTRIANSIVHNCDKGTNGPIIQKVISGKDFTSHCLSVYHANSKLSSWSLKRDIGCAYQSQTLLRI